MTGKSSNDLVSSGNLSLAEEDLLERIHRGKLSTISPRMWNSSGEVRGLKRKGYILGVFDPSEHRYVLTLTDKGFGFFDQSDATDQVDWLPPLLMLPS